ncbi:MAG: HDIG domain-containing protein [Lachnospiraceae bacterium]|nr:HDIG domain-containing protein [Lachnospiraceae bacterium]
MIQSPWLIPAVLPAAVNAAVSLIRNSSEGLLSESILLGVFGLVWFFVLFLCNEKHIWKYDNESHKKRFVIVFIAGILLSVGSCFLQPLLWLHLPLAAALLLFSDLPQAMSAYFLLLMLQQLISRPVAEVFVTYAMIGILGMLLFDFLDEQFMFGIPLFISLLFQTLLLLAMEFVLRGYLPVSVYVFASCNLLLSFLLLTGILKFLSSRVLHSKTDRFGELNDPECPLLSQLKETNKRAYYHAIHTAHFCQKLAEKIGADAELAKAGGYYHKIGKMRGESNLKNALEIAEEYEFPPELKELLMEYGGKNTPLRSKEAAIVLLSDAMVSSVMFLFDKNKDAKLNYEQIVSVVFSKQMESGFLDQCSLELGEMNLIRQCFLEERLYYDFLR